MLIYEGYIVIKGDYFNKRHKICSISISKIGDIKPMIEVFNTREGNTYQIKSTNIITSSSTVRYHDTISEIIWYIIHGMVFHWLPYHHQVDQTYRYPFVENFLTFRNIIKSLPVTEESVVDMEMPINTIYLSKIYMSYLLWYFVNNSKVKIMNKNRIKDNFTKTELLWIYVMTDQICELKKMLTKKSFKKTHI